MRLLSFDPLRCIDIPGVTHLKPEHLFRRQGEVRVADWVLFPPSWLANTLVYALKRRIFPNLAGYHLGFDKVQMTRAFQALCPTHLPHTLILRADQAGVEQALDEMSLPLVVKDPRSSMGRGVFLVENKAQLRELAQRLDLLYVQEYLPLERDLRVVWVGDRVVTAYWRVGAEGAFHNNVSRGGRVEWDEIPPQAIALVEQVATGLGLDHAGFDVAMVDGHPFLLEFNLLFGNEALNARGIRLGPSILAWLERQGCPPREPDKPLLRAV